MLTEERQTMLSIQTNTQSLNAQKNLSRTQKSLAGNFQKLSSGLRITRAGDDAAGLAISEDMKAQIRGLGQAERNANDGVSMLQTAEGAMNEVSGILTRMRELAVQASTDTVDDTQRGYLNQEFSALKDEVDRISAVTEFNGTSLLDGSASNVEFQVGVNNSSNDRISVSFSDMSSDGIGLSGTTIGSKGGAQSALSSIDTAIENVSGERAGIGATENRLNITVSNLQSARENLSAANSRIRDVDVASETASMTKNNILQQAGVAVLAQANQLPSMALSLI